MPAEVEPERTSEQQPVQVRGDVRVHPGGVDHFDGSAWGPGRAMPYRAVPDRCPHSELPAAAGVVTGRTGRGVPGLAVTGVVRPPRPAVAAAGRAEAVGV